MRINRNRNFFIRSFLICIIGMFYSNSWAESTVFDQVKRGQHLVKIGGCNDCHTAGYLMNEGNVPVEVWLTGDQLGWNGPWGTTYAKNLRLFVKDITEDQWVKKAKTLKRRPPMPWFNLNAMHDEDLRAIYQFIRSLGDAGKQAPEYIPPDVQPRPPFIVFPAMPKK